MAKIYILEKAAEPKQISTQNGNITRQSLTFRELDGDSQYTPRIVADYIGAGDMRQWEGHIVATHISQRFSRSEKGDFLNLQCREIISLGKIA